jgi:hypothetical protein
MDVYSFLNGILHDLGFEQNAEDWSTDPIRPGFEGSWTANLPGTRGYVEVWVDHFSHDATGYTVIQGVAP